MCMIEFSKNLRETWPFVFVLGPIMFVATFSIIPMFWRKCIAEVATEHVYASDLYAKLLAPSKK